MDALELFRKSLVHYDETYYTNYSFYDNLPYIRDYDLCHRRPMEMFSGNVIKFFQYKLDKPVYINADPDSGGSL